MNKKNCMFILSSLMLTSVLTGCETKAVVPNDINYDEEFNASLLKAPKKLEDEDNSIKNKNYNGYVKFVNDLTPFTCELIDESIDYINDDVSNFTISPLSIEMAMFLLTECSANETRALLLEKLGISYEELLNNAKLMFYNSCKEFIGNAYDPITRENVEKKYGEEHLTNSIWFNPGYTIKDSCLESLANNYYCNSFKVDFANENDKANKLIQEFIKEETRGLIDQNFNLDPSTVAALINTLYWNNAWGDDDLELTSKSYDFKNSNGSTTNTKLLIGNYLPMDIYETDDYSYAYTTTHDKYKVRFIVPKDGKEIKDVFNSQTLNELINKKNYNPIDSSKNTEYYTRCLFPCFEAESFFSLKNVFRDKLGLGDIFDGYKCDLTNLDEEENLVVSDIVHKAKLTINEKGGEGAAVTIVSVSESAMILDERIKEYKDFVVDKSFGYIITDFYDVPLFSGIVNTI